MLLCGEFDGRMFARTNWQKKRGEGPVVFFFYFIFCCSCKLASILRLTSCPDVVLYIFCSHPFSATKQVFPSLHAVLSHLVWLEEKWIFFCLFLQILYNKIKIHSICLKINGGKTRRRKFVCISSCTLALNVRGFSGLANVHFGCGFELLSDFEGTHTCTDITPLDFLPFLFCFVHQGV